jgi:hypothetical protein
VTDLGDGAADILLVGEIDLDVILRSGRPGTIVGEGLPGTGDDAPSLTREALDGRMADAAAGAGQDKSLSGFRGLAGFGLGHERSFALYVDKESRSDE